MDEQLKIKYHYGGDSMSVYNITPQNYSLLNTHNIKCIYIKGHYLDHFEIPQGIEYIELIGLGLKTLYIPEGVEHVNCSRNFLKTIEIPQSLVYLKANKNLLSEITFRSPTGNRLGDLDIRSNKFKVLDFIVPKKLYWLNAYNNDIQCIGESVKHFFSDQFIPEPRTPYESEEESSEPES
jgi:hypothetical protein